MSKQRYIKKSVYILTEGQTEEAYFSRVGEILGGDTEWKYSVTVEVREIIKGNKTDPIHMVKEAKKNKSSYDEIWVVFDKDRERDSLNQDAIKLATKSKIRIAFSSISFELWLILHFEKCLHPFERSDCGSRSTKEVSVVCVCNGTVCAKTYLKQPTRYPAFEKGKSLLYDDLEGRNLLAIENAAWVRNKKSPYTDFHTLNPYTDVDNLLAELLNLKRVVYLSIGDTFNFAGVDISVLNHQRSSNLVSVTLAINNQGAIAFLMNDLQAFSLRDDLGTLFNYTAAAIQLIEPGSNQNVVINFNINASSQSLTFKASMADKYFLIDLT
jgi:RloB-like protein